MGEIFVRILNMSLSGCFVIGAVLLLRLLLARAPKKYSYILWLLVFVRLLCPFTLESPFGLVPVKGDALSYRNGSVEIDTGIGAVDRLVKAGLEWAGLEGADAKGEDTEETGVEGAGVEGVDAETAPTESGGPASGLEGEDAVTASSESGSPASGEGRRESLAGRAVTAAGWVWALGAAALLTVGAVQAGRLRFRLRTAVRAGGEEAGKCPIPVYESGAIDTAFLLGLFRPRIYLPLEMQRERRYVIAHELTHRRRLDHLVKPVCYLAVVLHWFNPLAWLAFSLMTQDMEMSCDERVLKNADGDMRSAYAESLLKLSAKRSGLAAPLAFGETNTRKRIRHALKAHKTSVWIGAAAVLVILLAALTLLTTNGGSIFGDKNSEGDVTLSWGNQGEPLSEEEFYRQLSANRNPYIGDASANGRIIGLLPGLVGYEYAGTELQTSTEPYELTIFYRQTEPISVEEELENADIMARNAMYLFAAIENMGQCQFELEPGAWAEHSGSMFGYGREEMEEIYGPLYERSETPEGLRQLARDYDAYQEEMRELLNSTPVEVRQEYRTEGEAGSLGAGAEPESSGQGISAGQQDLMDGKALLETLLSETILAATEDDSLAGEHAEVHAILGGDAAVFREFVQSDREMVFYLLVRELTYDDSPLTMEEANAVSLEDAKEGHTDTETLYSKVIANRVLAGSSFPARVTISRDESGAMSVKEFWVPRPGDLLAEDIRAEFPEEYWNAAISMEGYEESLQEAMLQKISAYFAAEVGRNL